MTASLIDGQEHAVDPRSVILARILGVGSTLATGFAVLTPLPIAWLLGGISGRTLAIVMAGWALAFGGSALFCYLWPELNHRHLRYRVDQAGVRIKRGILWRKTISIPASRVQHTDVSQGPLQRRYGLATLTVHTAGSEGAATSLEGLDRDIAFLLRDHLLPDGEREAI